MHEFFQLRAAWHRATREGRVLDAVAILEELLEAF